MSNGKPHWLGFGLVASAGAGLLALTSIMHSAFAYGDDTAYDTTLVMGPSGLPIPPQTYLDEINNLYLHPFFPNAAAPQAQFTPEGFYSWTGVKELPIDTSVAQGRTILDDAVLQQVAEGHTVLVSGYSQSAGVSSLVMSDLAADGVPNKDVAFSLLGDVSAPNGGILERFDGLSLPSLGLTFGGATPGDLYPTVVDTLEYDGWADYPQYPLNLLSDINAVMGEVLVHPTYLDLTPDQITPVADGGQAIQLPTEGPTDTTYYMIPVQNLPLLDPLREVPIIGNPLADLLQPDLSVIVNLGYGNPDYGWSQGPANVPTEFGLFPNVDPATVLQDLGTGAQQGISAFMHDISTELSTSPAPSSPIVPLINEAIANYLQALAHPTVNSLSSMISSAYSTLLPTADISNAILTSLPAYDLSLFMAGIEDGNLLNAIGDPIAADTGLIPFLLGLEGTTLLDSIGFTGLIP